MTLPRATTGALVLLFAAVAPFVVLRAVAAASAPPSGARPAVRATPTPTPAARPVEPAISLHALGRSLGMDVAWLEKDRRIRLKDRANTIDFEFEKREIALNGLRVFLGDGVERGRRTLAISAIDRERLLLPILTPQVLPPRAPPRVIALDPGHGGRDSGTTNKALKLEEKVFTLDVARRTKTLLEARGFTVMLTRTDDSFVALPDRPARAAAAGADLFVSIHFNAVGAPTVRGVETYILTPRFQRSTGSDNSRVEDGEKLLGNGSDGWNSLLGYTMHRQVRTDLALFDRGLKRARFQVLREARCPAVMVEGGYLSHPEEAKAIATPGYRQKLAEAIADGITAYRDTLARLAEARTPKKILTR